jgi:hypothetical protein
MWLQIKRLLIIFVLLCVTSCGTTRVVFIKESADVVRMGPKVKGKVYFQKNGEWVLSKNEVILPEGWYAGALDGEEKGKPD